jgi:hypothetical protein
MKREQVVWRVVTNAIPSEIDDCKTAPRTSSLMSVTSVRSLLCDVNDVLNTCISQCTVAPGQASAHAINCVVLRMPHVVHSTK